MDKTEIKIGDITGGKFSVEVGVERACNVIDHIVDKMHCPPCEDQKECDTTLNHPQTGLVPRMNKTETQSKTNSKLLYASIVAIALYLFTLTVTILIRTAP